MHKPTSCEKNFFGINFQPTKNKTLMNKVSLKIYFFFINNLLPNGHIRAGGFYITPFAARLVNTFI